CNAWPARWRRHGKVESAPFTAPDVENLLMCWLSEQQQVQLQEQGQIDFAVTLTDSRRLRASAFVHLQGTSLALRLLPLDCPHLDDLQPPAVIPELLHSENGLILVTGATGSGKSTTLAAMVEYLNQHIEGHILTL
ncbi:ATPase, T2SS/T4P/T4SS family, partial [Escherichia coli]